MCMYTVWQLIYRVDTISLIIKVCVEIYISERSAHLNHFFKFICIYLNTNTLFKWSGTIILKLNGINVNKGV